MADQIREILRMKADALVRRSAEELMALLDPDFLYVNAHGVLFDRTSYIDTYCVSGRVIFQDQRISDVVVRRHPGFAVATMRVHDTCVAAGVGVDAVYRSLCVFGWTEDRCLWTAGQTMATP